MDDISQHLIGARLNGVWWRRDGDVFRNENDPTTTLTLSAMLLLVESSTAPVQALAWRFDLANVAQI